MSNRSRVITVIMFVACGILSGLEQVQSAEIKNGSAMLTGAGSTFINPLFSKWFNDYNKKFPKTEINYQSIGSGGGIKQLQKKTIDFAASDVAMSDDEMKAAGGKVLHLPVALGAVVISYNLPGFTSELKLDGEALSSIARGELKKWNDPRLVKLNPGLADQDKAIVFVYRSDSSGTTGVFTDYLGKADLLFKDKVGTGKAVKWPTGVGGKGNEGVTAALKSTVGAVGYVELTYALNEKLATALVKNKDGSFVKPTLDAVTTSLAAGAKTDKALSSDFRTTLTFLPGKNSYPISAMTYLLVFEDVAEPARSELSKFLDWAFVDGQSAMKPLGYANFPAEFLTQVKKAKSILNAKK